MIIIIIIMIIIMIIIIIIIIIIIFLAIMFIRTEVMQTDHKCCLCQVVSSNSRSGCV